MNTLLNIAKINLTLATDNCQFIVVIISRGFKISTWSDLFITKSRSCQKVLLVVNLMARNCVSSGHVVATFVASEEYSGTGANNLFRSASERFFKSLKRAHSSLAGSFSSLLFYNDDKESGEKAPGECDESDRRRGLRPPKQKLRPHSFAVGENCQPPIAGYKLKNSSSFLGINYFSLKYKLEYNYFIKLNS